MADERRYARAHYGRCYHIVSVKPNGRVDRALCGYLPVDWNRPIGGRPVTSGELCLRCRKKLKRVAA